MPGFADAGTRPRKEAWQIVGPKSILDDPAVVAAVADLKAALSEVGATLARVASRDRDVPALLPEIHAIPVEVPDDLTEAEARLVTDSAYERSADDGSARSVRLRARTPLGLAYALYDVAWRVRVTDAVPTDTRRVRPQLPYRLAMVQPAVPNTRAGPEPTPDRLAAAQQRFEKQIRSALRHGYNFVITPSTENYIPWPEPTYRARSARYRPYLERFIESAHAHHLRILLYGDELTYLPERLERQGAKLSVKDEHLWQALQAKYRDLLTAFPELDGVATRTGEQIPKFDLRTIDLMHHPEPEPSPRTSERYRRHLITMHEVVAGEFGKLFYHRTWVTNVHEQHSVPAVYREALTLDVPRDNLLLSIKLTSGDQWYPCEPFNATYGLTPHTTIAEGELYSGYQGGGSLLVYPGRYFQAAVQWATERHAKGISNGLAGGGMTADAMLHTYARLGWDPHARVETLIEDWAAATFGRAAAKDVARIFLMASAAIRDGMYLRPPGLRNWNPIPHLRTTRFVAKGYPIWDHGKTHERFLESIYLQCKPWLPETITELNTGVARYRSMVELYGQVQQRIESAQTAATLGKLLRHGLAVLELNRDYVQCFLAYFKYREEPTPGHRAALADDLKTLERSSGAYDKTFGRYDLQGIVTFIPLAERAVDDLEAAVRFLAESPGQEDVRRMFAERRSESEQLLKAHPGAPRIASWSGTVDGSGIVQFVGDTCRVKALSGDGLHSDRCVRDGKMPIDRGCKIVVKPLEVRGAACLVDAPEPETASTIRVYVDDPQPGSSLVRFEVYAVCE